MKRILLLLLISLFPRILSFSQTTYPRQLNDSIVEITVTQLKQTNLIFREHYKLKLENVELKNKITYEAQMLENAKKQVQLEKRLIASLQSDISNTEEYYKSQLSIQDCKYKRLMFAGGLGVTVSLAAILIVCLQ